MKRDFGALWHALVGLAVGLLVAIGGRVREELQHPGGELTRHQKLEAGAWSVGLTLAALIGLIMWWI